MVENRYMDKNLIDALEGVRSGLLDLALKASRYSDLLGLAAIMPDAAHSGSAHILSVINTERGDHDNAHSQFVTQNLDGRRLYLPASAAGLALSQNKSGFDDSKMNPSHLVGNFLVKLTDAPLLVQMAFDKSSVLTPEKLDQLSGRNLRQIWDAQHKAIAGATENMLSAARDPVLLSEALALDVPSVANAVLVAWDVTGSSALAHKDYPSLRGDLLYLKRAMHDIVSDYGGNVLRNEGDGQWLSFSIPDHKQGDYGGFFLEHVAPAIHELIEAHKKLGSHAPPIRVASAIGHIEDNITQPLSYPFKGAAAYSFETMGPVFWTVSSLLKSMPANGAVIGGDDQSTCGASVAVSDDTLAAVKKSLYGGISQTVSKGMLMRHILAP